MYVYTVLRNIYIYTYIYILVLLLLLHTYSWRVTGCTRLFPRYLYDMWLFCREQKFLLRTYVFLSFVSSPICGYSSFFLPKKEFKKKVFKKKRIRDDDTLLCCSLSSIKLFSVLSPLYGGRPRKVGVVVVVVVVVVSLCCCSRRSSSVCRRNKKSALCVLSRRRRRDCITTHKDVVVFDDRAFGLGLWIHRESVAHRARV